MSGIISLMRAAISSAYVDEGVLDDSVVSAAIADLSHELPTNPDPLKPRTQTGRRSRRYPGCNSVGGAVGLRGSGALGAEHYRKLYLEQLERCALLERGIIAGKKAERFTTDGSQLTLGVLGLMLTPEEPEALEVTETPEAPPAAPSEEEGQAPRPATRRATGRRAITSQARRRKLISTTKRAPYALQLASSLIEMTGSRCATSQAGCPWRIKQNN